MSVGNVRLALQSQAGRIPSSTWLQCFRQFALPVLNRIVVAYQLSLATGVRTIVHDGGTVGGNRRFYLLERTLTFRIWKAYKNQLLL
jgi:hypothetical protein